jgi:hypothetical protein
MYVSKKWVSVSSWIERSAVKSLEDIKQLKSTTVKRILKSYANDGIKPPYVKVETIFTCSKDDAAGDDYYPITLKSIEIMLDGDIDEIYLDFRPYTREGNPHDWGEFEPESDRESEIVMKLW